jgi:endopolyphosphatase
MKKHHILWAVSILLPAPYLTQQAAEPALHGRFLHITDFHLDLLYASDPTQRTSKRHVCHSWSDGGPRHVFGTYECDSPLGLVNATFDNLKRTLADPLHKVDFIISTGDYAR